MKHQNQVGGAKEKLRAGRIVDYIPAQQIVTYDVHHLPAKKLGLYRHGAGYLLLMATGGVFYSKKWAMVRRATEEDIATFAAAALCKGEVIDSVLGRVECVQS